jgi:hypothetical protein
MDKVERYREIIKVAIAPYARRVPEGLDLTYELVLDEKNDHYLVMAVGWQIRVRRIHHPLIHVDIIDGKVWIQWDGTEDGIAYDLEEAGIPKSDIVLAFHPADVRPHTGYAVA